MRNVYPDRRYRPSHVGAGLTTARHAGIIGPAEISAQEVAITCQYEVLFSFLSLHHQWQPLTVEKFISSVMVKYLKPLHQSMQDGRHIMVRHGFNPENIKPYRIDWRFLPDLFLRWKDTIRHAVNRMGGSERVPSRLAHIWFATVRLGVFQSMRSAGVVFVHVPRTGGTSISQALYGRNLPHLSMAYYQTLAGDKLAGLPSFAVIRDPVDRLVSAYRFIRAGGTSIIASSRYDPYGLAKAPSFDAFVRIIAAQPDCRKAYDTLRPQAAFVTNEDGRVLVDRLFAFDDLRNGRPELRAWVGAGALPHINETVATPIHCSAATHALIDRIYAEDRSLYRLVGKGQGPIRPIAIIRHRARRKSMSAALPS